MQEAQQPARPPTEAGTSYPQEFHSAEELRNHYRALKRRMQGPLQKPIVLPVPAPASLPAPEEPPAAPLSGQAAGLEAPHAASILTMEETPAFISRTTILAAVSAAAQLTIQEVCGRTRARPLVDARFVYYVLARKYSGASLPQIGKTAGHRDHTTVMHGIKEGHARAAELMPLYRKACAILKLPVPDFSEPVAAAEEGGSE